MAKMVISEIHSNRSENKFLGDSKQTAVATNYLLEKIGRESLARFTILFLNLIFLDLSWPEELVNIYVHIIMS